MGRAAGRDDRCHRTVLLPAAPVRALAIIDNHSTAKGRAVLPKFGEAAFPGLEMRAANIFAPRLNCWPQFEQDMPAGRVFCGNYPRADRRTRGPAAPLWADQSTLRELAP